MTLEDWIELVRSDEWLTFGKYLSGNDTQATGSHGAGPYIPKEVIFAGIPDLDRPTAANPDALIHASVDSHDQQRELRAIWYNQKTRDEARITRWGGSASPLLDPENTGALCLIAFRPRRIEGETNLRVWVCSDPAEEDTALAWLVDPLEPGSWVLQIADRRLSRDEPGECSFVASDFPDEWRGALPAGSDIVDFVVDTLSPCRGGSVDERLVCRRDCEFAVFTYLEKLQFLPRVLEGFDDLDSFLALAHRVTNTRKARSGRSLELQLKRIFEEEGIPFTHGARTERGKRPDFLFPSEAAYHDDRFEPARRRMLGVKTTCKDRWRQILTEADRISTKHLFTLQQGVSEAQFAAMEAENVRLVVPTANRESFPPSVRDRLMSLNDFVEEARAL